MFLDRDLPGSFSIGFRVTLTSFQLHYHYIPHSMVLIKINFRILLLACLMLSGCFPGIPNISKCWFYVYQSDFKAGEKTGLTAASFLCLQKDGSYTRDFGVFDYGTWTYADKKLILASQRNQPATFEIESLSSKEMMVNMGEYEVNFDGQPLPAEKAAGNPFSLENNRWRIPAGKKEDDASLRRRLANHCHFWEVYFTWALKTQQQYLDVRSTPTPIKIYGNGFALKNVEDEPGRWKTYFYDEEDCKKGFDIMKAVFDKHDIAFAQTDSKYKMFIGAFQQLEDALR